MVNRHQWAQTTECRCLNCMIDFVQNNPDYFIFLSLLMFLVYKVIREILDIDEYEDDDQDDDGGILNPDPILDLPPGVSLPSSHPEEKASEVFE